ncbi:MAG: hypothetical protein HYW78_04090 [Parcubacteria group bacterium]|nr:hypothetical protein [Parcubacteria group bacterium]
MSNENREEVVEKRMCAAVQIAKRIWESEVCEPRYENPSSTGKTCVAMLACEIFRHLDPVPRIPHKNNNEEMSANDYIRYSDIKDNYNDEENEGSFQSEKDE